jgi:predicted transcriptional regulator
MLKAYAIISIVFLYLKNYYFYSTEVSVMKKERSRWEIILDILKVTKEEKIVKNRIMNKANLDWTIFKNYFDFLQAEGFITKCNPDPDYYELTEKGKNFFQKLKEVGEVLEKGHRNTSILSRIFAVSQKETATELSL